MPEWDRSSQLSALQSASSYGLTLTWYHHHSWSLVDSFYVGQSVQLDDGVSRVSGVRGDINAVVAYDQARPLKSYARLESQ